MSLKKFINIPTWLKFVLIIVFLTTSILPISTRAHYTGYAHHEIVLNLKDKHLEAFYNLVLTFPDFQNLYPQIDQDKDDFISELESQNWLESWRDRFSIQSGSTILKPQTIKNLPTKQELESSLFPVLSFDLDFGEIDISAWTDFKITHSFRVTSQEQEYWQLNLADKNIEFNPDSLQIPDPYNTLGKWRQKQDIALIDNSNTITDNNLLIKNDTLNNQNLMQDPYREASNFLNQTLKDPNFSLWTTLILILIGFFIGAAHSLTPGHGKAIMGSYLSSIKGKLSDAALMGLSITLSHTGSVLVVALLFLWLKSGVILNFGFFTANLSFDLKKILPVFEAVSGVSIILIGFWMLRGRISDLINLKIEEAKLKFAKEHSHSHLNSDSEPHSHEHKQHHENYPHPHSGNHDHHHHHHIPDHKLNLKESVSLGFTTGLNPCVDAIAILILAINLDKIWLGISILLSFSLGMAATLTLIGYVLGLGVKKAEKFQKLQDFTAYIPIVSSIIIIILGILTLTQIYR